MNIKKKHISRSEYSTCATDKSSIGVQRETGLIPNESSRATPDRLHPHPRSSPSSSPPPSPGVCLRSRLWSSSWLRSTRTPYTAQTAFRVVQWLVKIGYPVGEPLPLNRAERVVCFLFDCRSKTILSTQCHCKNSHFEVRGPLRHLHMCKKKM